MKRRGQKSFFIYMVISLVFSLSLWAKGIERFDKPRRELSVILTDHGPYPETLVAYVGERVRFYVTNTAEKGQCFIVKNHTLFLTPKMGEIQTGDLVFNRADEYEFYCPSSPFKGKIVVIDPRKTVKELKRAPASTKPKHWIPKDL